MYFATASRHLQCIDASQIGLTYGVRPMLNNIGRRKAHQKLFSGKIPLSSGPLKCLYEFIKTLCRFGSLLRKVADFLSSLHAISSTATIIHKLPQAPIANLDPIQFLQ